MNLPIPRRFVDPNSVTTHFHLHEGDKVGDFGAGTGFFIHALSKAVGSEGRVYAIEIQKSLVEKIGMTARDQHLSNIEPLWADLEALGGTKLADGILDAGILVNTLFQYEQKETALSEMARVIRKGGKCFIIDWTESFAGMGPHPNQVIDETAARTLAEGAGFVFERTFPSGEHHYGLAFRKV
jgi:ubiquinone/menaquinone biosynthesis C-methylase UbiE